VLSELEGLSKGSSEKTKPLVTSGAKYEFTRQLLLILFV